MICSAAVKIFDKKQNKEIILPCHRHCDAFLILKEFGYKRHDDFEEIAQGFLDEDDNFMSRIEAREEAVRCEQLKFDYSTMTKELYSEDMW